MRLLVVDDDALFREQFGEFLEGAGHQVRTAPSAAKAMDRLAEEDIDVVFTDLKMPRQSGLDLLREVRRRAPRTLVVLVTGYASVPSAVEAMKGGAFDYLTKPFRAEQVEDVLRHVEAERAYTEAILPSRELTEVARGLASRGTRVLVLGALPAPVPSGVEAYGFDGLDLSQARAGVDSFLHTPGPSAVIVADLALLLEHHRLDDVVTFLEGLRGALRGRGPLAVGFDPRRVSREQMPALLSVLASEAVHGTIEAMDSPIRRVALKRMGESPARFADLMRACQLDDSPKLAFHLHRLEEAGLIRHAGELYRLTPKGAEAVATLTRLEQDAAGASERGFFFQRAPPPVKSTGPTSRPRRRPAPPPTGARGTRRARR